MFELKIFKLTMKIVLILILCVLTTQMSAQNHDFFDDEDTETLDRMDKEDLYTAAGKFYFRISKDLEKRC